MNEVKGYLSKVFDIIKGPIRDLRASNEANIREIEQKIMTNHKSAVNMFRGFFGNPDLDNDLMIAKKIVSDIELKQLNNISTVLSAYGFSLLVVDMKNGSFKVCMVPGDTIKHFVTTNTTNPKKLDVIPTLNSIRNLQG